jgi:hypothetical protein
MLPRLTAAFSTAATLNRRPFVESRESIENRRTANNNTAQQVPGPISWALILYLSLKY